MNDITESEILELFLEGQLCSDDIILLYQEGYLSEHLTTCLLEDLDYISEGKISQYAKTALKFPIKGVGKSLYGIPTVATGAGLGALAAGSLGAGLGSSFGPGGIYMGAKLGTVTGAKIGAALGGGIGALAGGKMGYKIAKGSGWDRWNAKVENWAHDKHFRNYHKKELKKALNDGRDEDADMHRNAMFKHQNRMRYRLQNNSGSEEDMDNFDRNGNKIKDIQRFYNKG